MILQNAKKRWNPCNGSKRTYPDKKTAETMMNLFRSGHGKRYIKKKPVRVYFCNKCRGWHITSLPKEIIVREIS